MAKIGKKQWKKSFKLSNPTYISRITLDIVNKILIIITVVFSLLIFGTWYLIGIFEYISADIAKTIFSTLIQVTATLIGFFGIMLAYNLKESNESKNMFMKRSLDLIEKYNEIKIDLEEETKDAIIKKLNKRLNDLKRGSDVYADFSEQSLDRNKFFGISGISVLSCFIVSITASVIALTKIETYGLSTMWVIGSLAFLFMGIIFLIFSMFDIFPKRKEDESEK